MKSCHGALERPKLTHAACKDTGGVVWSLPAPHRHHDVLRVMRDHDAKHDDSDAWAQGFLDECGHYLTRRQAMINAVENDQIKGGKLIGGILTSEDLW